MSRTARTVILLFLGVAAPATLARDLTAQEPIELEHVTTFPESFGFLQTVRPLARGGVMVADPLGQILARAHLETGTLAPVGREGAGPGEWSQPDAVFALPGDSTLLVDLGNARLSVIAPDGRIVDTRPMMLETGAGPMSMEIILPRGTDRLGRVYYEARGAMRGTGETGLDSSRVKRWTPGDEAATGIAALRPPAVTTATSGGRNDRQVMMRPIPLAPQDGWAVAPDGSVAVVRAEPFHVEWIRPDGSVVRGPEVDYRPVDVGTSEKERYLDELASSGLSVGVTMENGVRSMRFRRGGAGGGAQERAAQLRELAWPEHLPAFRAGGVLVGSRGRLWVQRFVAVGDPTRYDLFDRTGRRIATATLPPGRRVIGFDDDRVFAVNVDDLGLHWLEVYR